MSLNALSGAAYHYQLFGEDSNPGVFLYATFFTFYILDYFIFERVQLYTYDLIHENIGFKLFWGGLVVYGWLFILPLRGMAVHPDPGFSPIWTSIWLVATSALFLCGWGISRSANLQKYTFKRWPNRKFFGIIEPKFIKAGDRKILCSGLWGVARHFNYLGEGFLPCPLPWFSAISPIPGPGPTLSSSSCYSLSVNVLTTATALRNTAPKSGPSIRHGSSTESFPGFIEKVP